MSYPRVLPPMVSHTLELRPVVVLMCCDASWQSVATLRSLAQTSSRILALLCNKTPHSWIRVRFVFVCWGPSLLHFLGLSLYHSSLGTLHLPLALPRQSALLLQLICKTILLNTPSSRYLPKGQRRRSQPDVHNTCLCFVANDRRHI
jgi:hypothetical protein